MSTATIDTPETTRRTPAARRPSSAQPKLIEARRHTETAVTDLVSAAADAARALMPAAVLRPSEAVEYSFDLAEQILAGCRRACLETARLLEDGLDAADHRG